MRKHNFILSNQTDRRGWLQGIGRGILLSGLAGLTGWLTFGRRGARRENSCINQQICRSCTILRTCRRPEGLSARRVLMSSHHDAKTG